MDVARDQDDGAKPFMQVAFEQERHCVNDQLISGRRMLVYPLFGESAHARVDDRLEFFSRSRIVEDRRAQFLPIQGLVGVQDLGAECFHDLFPGVAPGFDNFARQCVSIDNGGAETLEDFSDGGFAGSDAAG